MNEHALCEVERDVAVLKEQARGAATALVLARDLVEAHRRSAQYLFIAIVGWIIAAGGIVALFIIKEIK